MLGDAFWYKKCIPRICNKIFFEKFKICHENDLEIGNWKDYGTVKVISYLIFFEDILPEDRAFKTLKKKFVENSHLTPGYTPPEDI